MTFVLSVFSVGFFLECLAEVSMMWLLGPMTVGQMWSRRVEVRMCFQCERLPCVLRTLQDGGQNNVDKLIQSHPRMFNHITNGDLLCLSGESLAAWMSEWFTSVLRIHCRLELLYSPLLGLWLDKDGQVQLWALAVVTSRMLTTNFTFAYANHCRHIKIFV